MLGPIIVVLNGSTDSERAIPLGVQLAQRSGAALHLTEVHESAAASARAEGTTVTAPPTRQQTHTRLLELAERCAALGTPADTIILEQDPIAGLVRHVEREHASLLITVARTPPTFRRVFSDNAADGLIRFAQAPVIVCPAASSPNRVARILVALDGSELAERALQSVRPFARGSEVILMQAICSSDPSLLDGEQPLASAIPLYLKNQRRVALEYLNSIADRMRGNGLRVSTVISEGVWPGPTIVQQSVLREVDLLAVATHGRTGFARRALGSCAADVLRLAPMPVIVAGPNVLKTAATEPAAVAQSDGERTVSHV